MDVALRNALAQRAADRTQSLGRRIIGPLFEWLSPHGRTEVHGVLDALSSRVRDAVRKLDSDRPAEFLRDASEEVRRALLDLHDCLMYTVPGELAGCGNRKADAALRHGIACVLNWWRVLLALDTVPGRDGDLLRWRFFLGIPCEEVSGLLQTDVDQCRAMLARALDAARLLITRSGRMTSPPELCGTVRA